ncbi:MAG: butyryl-CoA dehydrogenase [Deltaproteobacteria bacterium RBG_13_65_10]|nr:MAG: butyryl-CoA dehydrogenase [Deltaproteobacteria bacterium RBG_13_65_10]
MDFDLNEEQRALVETLRTMGHREKFKELAVEIEKTGEFPGHLMKKFAGLGLLGMTLSPEYGGGGQPGMTAVLAIEALAKFSSLIAAPVFESNLGPVKVIDAFGSDEHKGAVLPGVCKGEVSVSVCMTEPEAGSDLVSLSTTLTEDGGGYLLNGRKTFISGGGAASHYLVYCRFGNVPGYKGIGAILLEKGTAGFTFGKQEEFMGLRGMPSCDLIFKDVKVPRKNVVIAAGRFSELMTTFDLERCGNAAMCLGIAGGALEEAKAYTLERQAFGRPICEFQDIQFRIVDMAMKLDAARLLVYRAATGAGKGFPSMYESSMGKCFANEMVAEVTDKAMQILGGYGYSKEFPLERMHRDALAWRVAGGTVQMLRITMAGIVFGRRFNQKTPASDGRGHDSADRA